MRTAVPVPLSVFALAGALTVQSAGSEAWAQDAPAPAGPLGSFGPLSGFIPFLLIFVLFYFLLILPQQRRQKKHRAMLEALKKNDKVTTNGGVYGTVMSVSKDVVTLEIAPGVRIKLRRDAVTDLRTGDEEESK
ncbi:MAG: preprotein translocase subunit YajC [Nitrospirae bacterium]|nr:preprotein translocase subunit YajC [Nitrospirota bacterium]